MGLLSGETLPAAFNGERKADLQLPLDFGSGADVLVLLGLVFLALFLVGALIFKAFCHEVYAAREALDAINAIRAKFREMQPDIAAALVLGPDGAGKLVTKRGKAVEAKAMTVAMINSWMMAGAYLCLVPGSFFWGALLVFVVTLILFHWLFGLYSVSR